MMFTMAFEDKYGNNEAIGTSCSQSFCNEDSQIDNAKPHTVVHILQQILLNWGNYVS